MAVIPWVMGLSLLMHCCLCSFGQTERGCMKWTPQGENVCCETCYPGNRLVRNCGPSPKELCTPCEVGTYTVNPKDYSCSICTQCVGAQVYVKRCTATRDTECGCKDGLTCGDGRCTFCVKKCDKGQEPTKDRSCRKCPDGTFNDQSHQMCKPWKTKCPNPDQYIVAKGNEFTDSMCANTSVKSSHSPNPTGSREHTSLLLSFLVIGMALMGITIIVVALKSREIRKKKKKTITKTPIIRTPTDDPRTLIAIECSFHEAQQEQGSSSESLDSKDSSDQLIA
ncbi:tumor necrosis factor receptor superfamily member 9a [Xiphias gladius]|uniref:tumor necrosis factor receptor superfamily member 9a n=1 Tax=Xiphias gladius TaxID=8245 RepID=UPI001A98E35D|nr:tumor necrosis factor receptor superfamily member 9a [Xiphias gladius]